MMIYNTILAWIFFANKFHQGFTSFKNIPPNMGDHRSKKGKPTWIIVQVTVRKTPLSGDHILNLNKYIFHFCSSILCSY